MHTEKHIFSLVRDGTQADFHFFKLKKNTHTSSCSHHLKPNGKGFIFFAQANIQVARSTDQRPILLCSHWGGGGGLLSAAFILSSYAAKLSTTHES